MGYGKTRKDVLNIVQTTLMRKQKKKESNF